MEKLIVSETHYKKNKFSHHKFKIKMNKIESKYSMKHKKLLIQKKFKLKDQVHFIIENTPMN